jgi:hypothetical protein
MNGNVIFPPSRVRPAPSHKTIFLAGAIDNGSAVQWQKQVTDEFAWHPDACFYNPRRDDWDSSWVQKWDNPQFAEQVEWELDKINEADHILMFFPEKSVAPITLLEFGFISGRFPNKLIIAAEQGYWRRGNLEIVCRRERIELFEKLHQAMAQLRTRL